MTDERTPEPGQPVVFRPPPKTPNEPAPVVFRPPPKPAPKRDHEFVAWQIPPAVEAFQRRMTWWMRGGFVVVLVLIPAATVMHIRGTIGDTVLSLAITVSLLAIWLPLVLIGRAALGAEWDRRNRSVSARGVVTGFDRQLLRRGIGFVPIYIDVPVIDVTTGDGRVFEASPRPFKDRLEFGQDVAVLHDPETDQIDLDRARRPASQRSSDISIAVGALIALVLPQLLVRGMFG